ncbi:transposase [Pseudomonas sp. BN411]|uniref:transposase n=1 Tax=Pseudomonas sp. BN411 TaxID=2567887 RepID=UPI002457BD59|nr:transposase [Pseudomonas sp. BN411]MDH4562883.1 transposase [Pseudomonas sp. BN411]
MIDVITTRFDGLSDENRIRKIVTVRPNPVTDLEVLESSVGAEKFGNSLKEIYLPNKFSIDLIKEMVGRANLYCREIYDSEKSYLSRVYNPPDGEVAPICLTGLAGVGKSQTINALRKILPGPVDLALDHFEGVHRLLSHWYVSARGKAGGKQLLADFIGEESSKGRHTVGKLLVECRRRANRDGVALLMLEETQHINTGNGVSRVTDILLTMAAIGPPMVYVSNYSLVHRLLRRNSEDKQRLLVEPRIMLPDSPDSEDWRGYIRECMRVSNGYLSSSEDTLVEEVYRSTFGIKRLAVQLLKIAFLESRMVGRQSIDVDDIYRAYRSAAYSVNRRDVEELQRQAIESRASSGRLDLRCPFELPVQQKSNVVSFAKADRDNRVANKVFLSSLSEMERSTLAQISADPPASNEGSLAPTRRKPVPKATKSDLVDAFNKLLEPKPPGPRRPK